MTSSESQPRTRAGRSLFSRLWAANDYNVVSKIVAGVERDILAIEAEAARDSLPSPAPEPPPQPTKDPGPIPTEAPHVWFGQRGVATGGNVRRAAQPAPDLDLIREALTRLEDIGTGTSNAPSLDIATARNRLRSFLHARSAPEEASEGRSE